MVFMKDRYQTARLKYKPNKIRILFIAEAPPQDERRFFYYEDVTSHDALFINLIRVLYPDFVNVYGKSVEAIRDNKTNLLNSLKQDGYFLIDALPKPINLKLSSSKRKNLIKQNKDNLLREIFTLQGKNKNMQVVLIKATVYDALLQPLLKDKIDVINGDIKIPFPSQGHCTEFRSKLANLLKTTDENYQAKLRLIKYFEESEGMLPELSQRLPKVYWLLAKEMEYGDFMDLQLRITKTRKFDDLSQPDQALITNAEKRMNAIAQKRNRKTKRTIL